MRVLKLLFVMISLSCHAGVELEHYEPVERDAIDSTSLSEIGRLVLEKSTGVFGSNGFVIAHAASLPELARLIKEASYARIELDQLFGASGTPDATPIFIASVSNPRIWDEIIKTHGLRRDGLAMRLGREIYFESGELPENRPDRVMHEMVHVRTGDFFSRIPHAMDEGLASYLGWTFAAQYQAGKNLALVRKHQPLDAAHLYSLDELLTMRDYPRGPTRIRAFYRQSELLVEQLVERKGISGLRKIMDELELHPADPVVAFRRVSGIDPEEELAMMQSIKEEVMTGSVPEP